MGSDEKIRILEQDIHKDYKNGYEICMLIDGSMMNNDDSYTLGDFEEYHWIVYEGNLQLLNNKGQKETDYDDISTIKFDVYTWGENINNSRTTKGISKTAFRNNYYGYIRLK